MEKVTASRTQLLALRARIELAERSRDLLEDKRNELMKEYRKAADKVLAGGDALERNAAEARRVLGETAAIEGPEPVRAAALAAQAEVELQVEPVVVLGVRVPEITWTPLGRGPHERGYELVGTSPRIDEVAERFERQLELVLQVATEEVRLRRLGDEITKVTRRVNALEHVVVPEHEAQAAQVAAVLEERERQDHFRLKRIKAHKQRPAEGP
jgi:V/A-type H+-transporting ATPase subunit D